MTKQNSLQETITATQAEVAGVTARQLVEALDEHAIVSIADRWDTIIYANEAFYRVSGYNRDEVIGSTHQILNSGLHKPAFFKDMWSTIESGEKWQGLLRNQRKDGEYFWVQTTITPVADKTGKPEFYISIRTEIPRIKQSEEALTSGGHFLNMLNDHTQALLNVRPDSLMPEFGRILGEWADGFAADHALILEVDKERNELHAVQQYPREIEDIHLELGRLRRGPLSGSAQPSKRAWITDRGNVREAFSHSGVNSVLQHHGFNAELTVPVFLRGEIALVFNFLSFTHNAFRDLKQKLFFAEILGDVLSNAYQRIHNERELLRQQQKLDSRQLLAHIGDWDMDIETSVIRWSPALFGYDQNIASLQLAEFISLVHQDDRSDFLRVISTTINQHIPANFEFRLINSDRDPLWAQVRGARIRDKEQQTDMFVGTLIDVSRIKNTEEQLTLAKRNAEEASAAKSQFLSNMSHELRTPLNSILGFGQLLEIDDRLSEDHRENTNEILNAGRHLLNLINDILELSVIQSGSVNLTLERCSVGPLIEESVAMLSGMAKQKGVTVTLEKVPDTQIFIQPTKFKQVIINLLSNAIKYNRQSGSVKVICSPTRSGRLRIAVSDTGIGISREHRAELFTAFNRLGREKTLIEGSGIGLSFTRAAVGLMGGDVSYYPNEDVGSTFYLEFPATSPLKVVTLRKSHTPGNQAPQGIVSGDISAHDHKGADVIMLVTHDTGMEAMLRRSIATDNTLKLRRILPEQDLTTLAGNLNPGVIFVDVGDFDAGRVTDKFVQSLGLHFPDARLIAFIEPQFVRSIGSALTGYFSLIITSPADETTLQSVLH